MTESAGHHPVVLGGGIDEAPRASERTENVLTRQGDLAEVVKQLKLLDGQDGHGKRRRVAALATVAECR